MLCSICLHIGAHLDELFLEGGFSHHLIAETVDGVERYAIETSFSSLTADFHRWVVPKERGVEHHANIPSLISAAEAGCELCKLIVSETRTSTRGFMTSLACEDKQIYACMLSTRWGANDASMMVFHQTSTLHLEEEPRLR